MDTPSRVVTLSKLLLPSVETGSAIKRKIYPLGIPFLKGLRVEECNKGSHKLSLLIKMALSLPNYPFPLNHCSKLARARGENVLFISLQ